MLKDFFFTFLAFALVFAGFLYWNDFWREYLSGRVQYRLGKPELAIDHFKNALEKSPKGIITDAESELRQEILGLSHQIDWKVSESYIDSLVKMTTDRGKAHEKTKKKASEMLYKLGTELREKKSGSELERISDLLLKENPNSSLPYLFQGETYLIEGNPKEAIKSLEKTLERDPFYERALMKLVDLYQERKKHEDIVRVAEPHQDKVKPSFQFYSTLGKAYFSSKQPEKAVKPLKQSLDLKPRAYSETLLLGRIGAMLDREDLADYLKEAWKLNPGRADLIKKWLEFQSENDKHKLIVNFFDENLLPEEEFQVILLESLVKTKNFEKFQRFLEHTPLTSETHPEIQFFHGTMAFEKGDLKTAELELKEFIHGGGATHRQMKKSLEFLVSIAQKKGKPHLERSYLRQLMQLIPGDSEVYRNLGETYEKEGKNREALKAYLEALDFFPENSGLLEKAARLLYQNEAYFKVIELLSAAPFLPDNPSIPVQLARAYVNVYDYESARRALSRFQLIMESGGDIPDDLRFLLDESAEAMAPPEGFEQTLEEIHQREAQFLRVLSSGSQPGSPQSKESKEKLALGRFLRKKQFSDMSYEEFQKMILLLFENGAYSKVIEFLSGKEEVLEEPDLAFLLARSLVKQYDYFAARSIIRKILQRIGNPQGVPKDLSFLLGDEIPSLPISEEEKGQKLEEMRSQEEKYLSSLREITTRYAKNTLPPDPALTRKIRLYGTLRGDYTYKGNGEVFIPEGRKIALIDALSEAQQEILKEKEGRPPFFLARYRGKLHQIDARYVEVVEEPAGERVGLGKIVNLDANYSARAEMEKDFLYGERVQILQSTVHDKDQVMLFDDESYVSFFSVPKEGFSIQDQSRVFHHFRKDALKLEPEYEYLKGQVFSEIFEMPSESRLVLFGPEGGGMTLYGKESSGTPLLMHQISIHKMIEKIERYQRNYSRIDYVGSLVIDLNDDQVLDYLTLWRSNVRSHRALIHAAVSNVEGKFRDFLIPTDLTFIANYGLKSRISLLNFLRDTDLDGHLEILVSRPYAAVSGMAYQVPWFEIFQIRKDNLENASREFPGFYQEQKKDLRRLRRNKEKNMKNRLRYESWYAGYLKAMQRLQEIIGTS